MEDRLIHGELVVAKGKLARVQQELSAKSIRVKIDSTGETLLVSRRDIERIDGLDVLLNEVPDIAGIENYSDQALLVAAERYEVIKMWRAGELPLSEACSRLKISKSYFYRLAHAFNEDLGSLSVVLAKRGMKDGATRLSETVERIIAAACKKIFEETGSFSKTWVEVDVACHEQGIASPCIDTVTRRIKASYSARRRAQIKNGSEAASQTHTARPGKKEIGRPLQWVQMDHTLVDIMLLADDRINIIGRPWLTVLIDVKTRVILGYYLSLHVPSAISVACALSNGILPKGDWVKALGLSLEDYPFYGKPEVLHMDNAAEFTSPKFKAGCSAFKIDPEYRPIGKKHYGGHVESLIGTFMTTKVHFLKGTTMSNTVARRKVDSEKNATMTFSDFTKWFAREVVIYHSTVHSEIDTTPRQAWTDYFAPNGGVPYPPHISERDQIKLYFMPEESRRINPDGIKLHGNTYWDPVLAQYVGTNNAVVKFDPFNMGGIWVKLKGKFCPIRLSDLTTQAPSFEEYRASKFFKRPIRAGSIADDLGRKAYREKQEIERSSASLTRKARRQHAAEKEYNDAYPNSIEPDHGAKSPQNKPDYSRLPTRFKSEEQK